MPLRVSCSSRQQTQQLTDVQKADDGAQTPEATACVRDTSHAMEICFPINTFLLLSHTLANLEGWWVGRGGGGGGGPASCSFVGFLVWGNKALFYVEKGRDGERGLCQSLELRAQPPCFCFVHCCKNKSFFLNLWSHFILVKFKYGQMSREVHSVVINCASNWLICHLEAVFVCLFTKWLPQDGKKTEKLNDARLWSGNPIIQNLQLLFQLQSFQTLAFSFPFPKVSPPASCRPSSFQSSFTSTWWIRVIQLDCERLWPFFFALWKAD